MKVFACPECDRELEPEGTTPGRQVKCPDCGTWVEVPFLRRTGTRGRWTRKQQRERAWRIGGSIAAGLLVVVVSLWLAFRPEKSGARAEITRALDEAKAAKAAGRVGDEFRAVESALTLARQSEVEPAGGLDSLVARRDELARLDVTQRLEQLGKLAPDAAFGEALTLWQLGSSDQALRALEPKVLETVSTLRNQWLSRREAEINALIFGGKWPDALERLESLARQVESWPVGSAGDAPEKLKTLARRVIEERGAVIEPVALVGKLPYTQPYDAALAETIGPALRSRGYLVPGADSRLGDAWSAATNRLQVEVNERIGGRYLAGPNATTAIEATLTLRRAGQEPWRSFINAKTRVPLPGIQALEATRLEAGREANPEIERRFYDDARRSLAEQLVGKLKTLPAPGPAS